MESSGKEDDKKKELDDSGCVQDVGPPPAQAERPPELMDFSDDVLLMILAHCTPRDLKALGFTCPRLGRLIRDRTLWTRVDHRSQPCGRARMRWLLNHALNASTTELLLSGYAREARGCSGHPRKKKDLEGEKEGEEKRSICTPTPSAGEIASARARRNREYIGTYSRDDANVQIVQVDPLSRLQHLYSTRVPRANNHSNLNTPSRFGSHTTWPEEDMPQELDPEDVVLLDGTCPGPQFTLTQCMLRQLRTHCNLTSLGLEYCNLNCNTTGISHFPSTLRRLSLKGSKCYNLPLDKSFLFNIQDYLPDLEYLNLSECEWLEPASLLPLSKVVGLRQLVMRDCPRMSEFVAYASLATRYGFRRLEMLDMRGSPVADSEVSALGWLPVLQQLYIAPSRQAPEPRDHAACVHQPPEQLDPWETEEPEYFKIKPQAQASMKKKKNMTIDEIEDHIEQLRDYESNICLHGTEYNLCTEGMSPPNRKRPCEPDEQTPQEDTNATPSTEAAETTAGEPKEPKAAIDRKSEEDGAPSAKKKKYPKDEDDKPRPQNEDGLVAETAEKQALSAMVIETANEKPEASHAAVETSNEKPEDCPMVVETASKKAADTPMSAETANEKPEESPMAVETSNEKLESKVAETAEPAESTNQPKASSSQINDQPSCSNQGNQNGAANDQQPSCSNQGKQHGVPPKRQRRCDDSDCSDDDDDELQVVGHGINVGASTSKEVKEDRKCRDPDLHSNDCNCAEQRLYEFVRFRQNMDPVVVKRNQGNADEQRDDANPDDDREVRPRAHVLYVNVGQQLHTVYRLSIHNEPPIFYSFAGNSHLRFRPNVGNLCYAPSTPHLDATSLVTDSSIRRFGRADVEDVNYVQIGPRQFGDPGARPTRSPLRILSVVGFRNITDRSLEHLATAAPDLTYINFSGTRVTANGVEMFKSMRPDCEVVFSEFKKEEAEEK